MAPALSGSAAFDPLAWRDIITGAGGALRLYLNAEAGAVETSPDSGVLATWADQSGNSRDGTAIDAPTWTVGLNSRRIVTTDGSNDAVDINWNPVAPGTEPFWYYLIARMNSGNASGDRLFSGQSNTVRLGRGASDSTIVANNGSSSAAQTMTVGTWYRIYGYFSGATSGTNDYIKVGSAATATGAFGNSEPNGFRLGSTFDGASFGAFSFPLILIATTDQAAQVAALDALTVHATLGYGSGVEV